MPPEGRTCHQRGGHATRRAGTPPHGRTCHHAGGNTTRGAGTPPRGRTCHQTGRNATTRAGTPPEGRTCHQRGGHATTRARMPPDGQEHHQRGRNTTTRAGTPPDGQECHHTGRNATTRAGMPPHGQERHQRGGHATTRAGTPPEGRTCHHAGKDATRRAGTPPEGQEHHHAGRNATTPKQAGGLQIGLQFSPYRLMFNVDNSYHLKDAPFNPRIINLIQSYLTLFNPTRGNTPPPPIPPAAFPSSTDHLAENLYMTPFIMLKKRPFLYTKPAPPLPHLSAAASSYLPPPLMRARVWRQKVQNHDYVTTRPHGAPLIYYIIYLLLKNKII